MTQPPKLPQATVKTPATRSSTSRRPRRSVPTTLGSNPGIDQVLSHWLVKVIVAALLALGGYVYNDQLGRIFTSIEKQTDAVTALKADLSEFKIEQRSIQTVTTAQYTSLATRVDSIERALEAKKAEETERFKDWQKTYQLWLEEDAKWKQRGRGR
jgi:hypothetical protein